MMFWLSKSSHAPRVSMGFLADLIQPESVFDAKARLPARKSIWRRFISEMKFEGELDDAPGIARQNPAESVGVDVGVRRPEIRPIEQIEKLRAELQAIALRECEGLVDTEGKQRRTRRSHIAILGRSRANLPGRVRREGRPVEILEDALPARPSGRQPRIAEAIRPVRLSVQGAVLVGGVDQGRAGIER